MSIDAISNALSAAVAAVLWALNWVLCRAAGTILVVVLQSFVLQDNRPMLLLAVGTDVVRFLIRRTCWLPILLGAPVTTLGMATFFVAVRDGASLLPVPTPGHLGATLLNPYAPVLAGIEAAGRADIVWALTHAMLIVILGALLCTASVRNAWLWRHRKQSPPEPITVAVGASCAGSLLIFVAITFGTLHSGVIYADPLENPAAALSVGWWRLTYALRFAVPCSAALVMVVTWCCIVLNGMETRKELRRMLREKSYCQFISRT